MLNLALGLRMPDPSVDRQDIQLREQTFELRAALLEAGKLCAIVRRKVGITTFFVLNRGAIASEKRAWASRMVSG